MKKLLFLSLLAAAWLASSAAAVAQFSPPTNLWQKFDRGLTLGANAFTNEAGTLRWNPVSLIPEFSDGASWRQFGTGSGAVTNLGLGLLGSGTTNPLAVDPSVAAVSTGRVDGAAMVYDAATDRYGHEFVARAATTDTDYAPLLGTDVTIPKGQLVHVTLGLGAGSVYSVANPIDLSDKTDMSWLPYGDAATNYWIEFVLKPADGAQGVQGIPGMDAIGDLLFGPWNNSASYAYATNPWVVVEYDGQWYRLVDEGGSAGEKPTDYPDVWTTSVARGQSGTITVVSNMVDRGTWKADTQYTTNDSVLLFGNRFYVSETNQQPVLGVPPPLDGDGVGYTTNWWTLDTARGPRGLTGPSGVTTQYFQYFVYSLMDTNYTVFDNSPAATRPMIRWTSESGGTNHYEYTSAAWLGTNYLTASNGVVYLNGKAYSAYSPAGALRLAPEAALADGVAAISTTSSVWHLAIPDSSACTNVSVSADDAAKFAAFGLLVSRGTNVFAWPPGNTNSSLVPPNDGTTNLFFLYRYPGATNWIVDR